MVRVTLDFGVCVFSAGATPSVIIKSMVSTRTHWAKFCYMLHINMQVSHLGTGPVSKQMQQA